MACSNECLFTKKTMVCFIILILVLIIVLIGSAAIYQHIYGKSAEEYYKKILEFLVLKDKIGVAVNKKTHEFYAITDLQKKNN